MTSDIDTKPLPMVGFIEDHKTSAIFIMGEILHIHLCLSSIKINLFTCGDLVKDIRKHIPVENLKHKH